MLISTRDELYGNAVLAKPRLGKVEALDSFTLRCCLLVDFAKPQLSETVAAPAKYFGVWVVSPDLNDLLDRAVAFALVLSELLYRLVQSQMQLVGTPFETLQGVLVRRVAASFLFPGIQITRGLTWLSWILLRPSFEIQIILAVSTRL